MIRVIEDVSNIISYKNQVLRNSSSNARDIIDLIESDFYLDKDRNYGKDVIDYYLDKIENSYNYHTIYLDDIDYDNIHKYFHGYIDDIKSKYIRDDTYEYYNPHPKGKNTGDCVKRALTKVTGLDYMEIQRELNHIKREIGASVYSSNDVWKEYIKRNNFRPIKFSVKRGEPRMNGYRFAVDYPKGKYILNMAKHLSCCVDGIIYDTWDCRSKCVYNAFEYLG